VEGVQQPDGSVAANEVEIEDVELEGLVSALGGSCPNLTFMVNGTSVETNSSTRFDEGRCSDIQNGEKIEVEGLRQPNGSVVAQNIEVDEGHHGEVELKGLVSGLGGACPAITFIVNGVAVATNSSTEFDDGPCGGVQNGSNVEVKGIRQADGSVVAREVEMEDFEVEGTVSGLSGTCPNLTFVVNGTTVVTNSVSKFDDGPCTGVQNGLRVEVEGLRQSNGSLLAHKVELDDD
jgi:hypothetical protein